MYIPAWLIIGGIILAIYLFSKSRKGNPSSSVMNNPFKQNFSYKLDIHIEPNWYALYKRFSGAKSDEELKKSLDGKLKKLDKDDDPSLWGRRYFFTEYYDSASGLTQRFQRVIHRNGKQSFYPVDEFGDSGFILDSDNSLHLRIGDKDYDEKKAASDKLSVDIGEDYIRNDIFDKYIGGPRSNFDYEKENYAFQFPLSDVFSFLFELGQRFHDTERNTIIKWPDQIENKFKELGIDYETYFDHEPKEFDIEKHDKEFFEKWGKPKICLYSSKRFNSGHLVSKDKHYYGAELKIFRPGENERVGIDG